MYIVTFEELYRLAMGNEWLKCARMYKTTDEAKDFVEYLIDTCADEVRCIKVWEALEISYTTATKVEFGK